MPSLFHSCCLVRDFRRYLSTPPTPARTLHGGMLQVRVYQQVRTNPKRPESRHFDAELQNQCGPLREGSNHANTVVFLALNTRSYKLGLKTPRLDGRVPRPSAPSAPDSEKPYDLTRAESSPCCCLRAIRGGAQSGHGETPALGSHYTGRPPLPGRRNASECDARATAERNALFAQCTREGRGRHRPPARWSTKCEWSARSSGARERPSGTDHNY